MDLGLLPFPSTRFTSRPEKMDEFPNVLQLAWTTVSSLVILCQWDPKKPQMPASRGQLSGRVTIPHSPSKKWAWFAGVFKTVCCMRAESMSVLFITLFYVPSAVPDYSSSVPVLIVEWVNTNTTLAQGPFSCIV